ncbi:hypothetical protein CK203_056216 [Vitis vinifera]|uniref:Uncharacterized protein n=1 Tax=Vitis vinifera TaxID=29760 RepID=A0A438GDF9_VITVI|nr:hypothetical protein CK203_056216 [Vitis vinifera]
MQMNMGSEDVNEDLFGLEYEDFGEEIDSLMNITNISSGVTYPSFQPMIEVIGQYGVGMKGPTFHEVLGAPVRVFRLVDGEKKAPISSGCERNWSIFENIHSKRRNMLDHQRLNDLGDVARGTGAKGVRFDTKVRAKASSSIISLTRGITLSSRTLPSHLLIDEDEDGDMVDSVDEEDGEGYKYDDRNDDDNDFVDSKEE